jgi:hypothetical protein
MAVKKACNLVKGDVIDLGGTAWVVSGQVAPDVYNRNRVDVPLRRNMIGGAGQVLGFGRHREVTMSAEPNRRAGL